MRIRGRIIAVGLAVVAAAGGTALATKVFMASGLMPAASPGAAAFTNNIRIMPDLNAAVPGDLVVAVREGRDDISPYASIVWLPGETRTGGPLIGILTLMVPNLPLFSAINPVSANAPAGVIECTYRPTNDPVNPGWAIPPGGTATAGQLEAAVSACHHFAEEVRHFIRLQDEITAGFPSPRIALPFTVSTNNGVFIPHIDMELDMLPSSPTFGEFYKYDILTR